MGSNKEAGRDRRLEHPALSVRRADQVSKSSHRSDILDTETFLHKSDDHFQLSAFTCVTRLRYRNSRSSYIVLDDCFWISVRHYRERRRGRDGATLRGDGGPRKRRTPAGLEIANAFVD